MHSYKNYRTNKNEPDGSLRMRDFVAVGGFGQGCRNILYYKMDISFAQGRSCDYTLTVLRELKLL